MTQTTQVGFIQIEQANFKTMETIKELFERYLMREITEQECANEFDKLSIRGDFQGQYFTGYDYLNQKWIQLEG